MMAMSFDPPEIWSPFGAFSQTVIAGDGRLVFLKGQVALGKDGQVIGENDIAMQVEKVLVNIATSLSALGGRMSDVVSLQQFTTDIQAFMTCSDIRSRFFHPPFPVTTTVEVSSLYDPRLMVEITTIAEIPSDRFKLPAAAKEMHGACQSCESRKHRP